MIKLPYIAVTRQSRPAYASPTLLLLYEVTSLYSKLDYTSREVPMLGYRMSGIYVIYNSSLNEKESTV